MMRLIAALAVASCVALWAMPSGCEPGSGLEERMRARSGLPRAERIALWALDFVGTPYDPDPLGAYVTRRAIVADDAVDCMYHVFRSAELGLSNSPQEAGALALELRFHTKGRLGPDGRVVNYDERFQYGEDMPGSGKWGRDITAGLGAKLVDMPGSRGISNIPIVPASGTEKILPALKSGDIVFFVKDPARRVVGEIIGHMGVIVRDGEEVFLVHASGLKSRDPRSNIPPSNSPGVVKIRLLDYTRSMSLAGLIVTRF